MKKVPSKVLTSDSQKWIFSPLTYHIMITVGFNKNLGKFLDFCFICHILTLLTELFYILVNPKKSPNNLQVASMSIQVSLTFGAKVCSVFQEPTRELYFQMRTLNAANLEKIWRMIDEERGFFSFLVFAGLTMWFSVCVCASFGISFFLWVEVFEYYFGSWSFPFNVVVFATLYVMGLALTMMTLCLALIFKTTQIQLCSFNEHFKAMLCINPEDNNEEWQNRIYRNLCSCVKEYLALATLTKMFVEKILLNTFGPAIFFIALCFLNIYFQCLQGLRNKEYFQLVCAVFLLWYTIIILWTICACGQRVTDESRRLTDVALDFPWLTWNAKNRKALLLILTMANKPIDICLKIFKVDYALAMNIMRMSFSYALTFYQMENA